MLATVNYLVKANKNLIFFLKHFVEIFTTKRLKIVSSHITHNQKYYHVIPQTLLPSTHSTCKIWNRVIATPFSTKNCKISHIMLHKTIVLSILITKQTQQKKYCRSMKIHQHELLELLGKWYQI
jgi:hypothetical protein